MVLTQSVALVEFFDKTENATRLSPAEGQRLCPSSRGVNKLEHTINNKGPVEDQ